ncbi:type III-B CRISPR module RAMP protein Cmr4 [Synechocystis sp. PCC 7338]|uniref:type III-B CRISPR module RAMP protein Cmr4 n=1 Tax=Synechocystis sp. PCC 7338 TaxID=2732530 RepID=UPI001BB00B24|nr:type III-B CRISPR module RAMP protein Cmr4 [Synechocystis sp. PCC 7338]QUS62541.1 type III-B CRISPR module RAMP protein Cmr4 [Synechocystis sp. PCC 7338]
MNIQHFYLLAPLHTGGTTQEGNLLGIARESHTNYPYIPSSSIRGKIRSLATNPVTKIDLFGPELNSPESKEYEAETGKKIDQLSQGSIWIGDGSLLWIPIPSLSHGVIWISCPLLLNRYARVANVTPQTSIVPYLCNFQQANEKVYLKDAIFEPSDLTQWQHWQQFIPTQLNAAIERVLVLPDQHCATVIQMGLWRQVKIKLDQHKTVDGGFRYEEAIPPDTLMYFPWGTTSQTSNTSQAETDFNSLLTQHQILQIGGQESLGRGFVECF